MKNGKKSHFPPFLLAFLLTPLYRNYRTLSINGYLLTPVFVASPTSPRDNTLSPLDHVS